MDVEAQFLYPHGEVQFTASAALAAGEVIQLPDGRAGVVKGAKGFANGETAVAYTKGVFKMAKATGAALTAGNQVEWHTTNNNVVGPTLGGFDVGRLLFDAASAAAECFVDLNQA